MADLIVGQNSTVKAGAAKASVSPAVVQVLHAATGAMATGSTQIPVGDGVPQKTDGTEALTLAITPKSATNNLLIEVKLHLASSAGPCTVIGALFQDDAAAALACAAAYGPSANEHIPPLCIHHFMPAGTIAETIFKVRFGPGLSATVTLNGAGGARRFGGVLISSITITEITP